MKKEEFFDTLGDVEQKYINEAFFDDLDNSLGVAKPGKAKITPMKILAPIAACLAVAVGAAVGVPKLVKLAAKPNESDTSNEEIIAPNMNMLSNFERGAYTPTCDIKMDFTPEDLEKQFIFDCCGMVASENPDIIGDVTSWRVFRSFGFSGANYYYFIMPQIDGRAIPEIGVRVFNKVKVLSTAVGETYRLGDRGSFGLGYADINLENRPTDYFGTFYYYRVDVNENYTRESIQMLSINPETDEIAETTRLEKISYENRELYKTGDGVSISEKEFIQRWNNYPYIPKIYTDFTAEEADECRELLKANHNIPDDWRDCWREAERDIDLDGTQELLLAPQQCDIQGIYVFAKTADGLKEVGSFDTDAHSFRASSYIGSAPEEVWYRNVSADNYFPYYEIRKVVNSSDLRMSVTQASVNKILVDENGSITLVPFLERGTEILDEEAQTTREYYRLNGKDITYEECKKEWNKYSDYGIESTVRSTTIPVPTDPANKAW